MRARYTDGAALVVLLSSTIALAETTDAEKAGEEANLESLDERHGFWAMAGLGGGTLIGGGTRSSGGLTLALGSVMRPNWVAMITLSGFAQQHEVMDERKVNSYTTLMVAAQWWPNGGSLYARAGGGFGFYSCSQCIDPDEVTNPTPIDYSQRGIAGTFAVGIDLVRFKGLVLGLEAATLMTISAKDGVLAALVGNIYLSLD